MRNFPMDSAEIFKAVFKANAESFQQRAALSLDCCARLQKTQFDAWRDMNASAVKMYRGTFSTKPLATTSLDGGAWKESIEKNMAGSWQAMREFLHAASSVRQDASTQVSGRPAAGQKPIAGTARGASVLKKNNGKSRQQHAG